MITISDVERSAMQLPQSERAKLASHLLDSLPADLTHDDEGVDEAIRRNAELESDPSQAMTMQEFQASFES